MAKRIATCAALVALAMIFSYVEAILPVHFGVPALSLGWQTLWSCRGSTFCGLGMYS